MAKQKLIGTIALGAVLCLLVGASSFAATVNVGDNIVFYDTAGRLGSPWVGGAFHLKDTTTGFEWNSFCLEKNEYINFGVKYSVFDVGLSALLGGVGNSGTPGVTGKSGSSDPISSQTAYLYFLYATNGIAGVTGAGTPEQQKALQNVFWYLENEIFSIASGDETTFFNLTITAKDGDYYGVAVVNPVSLNLSKTPKQSQLVYIPISVPEAGALLLFGTGLVGLVGYRRVRRMQ
jgi:hypothetical protein